MKHPPPVTGLNYASEPTHLCFSPGTFSDHTDRTGSNSRHVHIWTLELDRDWKR